MSSLHLVLSLFASIFLFKFISPLFSHTRKIPGPWPAYFTSLWYFLQVKKKDFHLTNIRLHHKYGTVVRITPEYFSINDPDAIKVIFGHGSAFEKSRWYDAWNQSDDIHRTNLFSERDSKSHAMSRRKVSALYSMTSLVSYEELVNECISILREKFMEFSASGIQIDLALWLQYFAFDVIGQISFGRRFGFLENGVDSENVIAELEDTFVMNNYSSIWPGMIKLSHCIYRFIGMKSRGVIIRFAQESITRTKETKKGENNGTSTFVQKLEALHRTESKQVSDWDVLSTLGNNIGAGSDTTAISLSAVLFFVFRSPRVLQKLREEIKLHSGSNNLPFKETLDMPYLQATIKEALRMHPAVGIPLWRRVPRGGKVISGHHFPENTNVGINAWVAHRNRCVFGDDADLFRPERWLEASTDALQEMERYYMPFGLGSRTCIGKNISLLEMNKVIPVLVRDFEFDFENKSQQEMEAKNFAFVKPTRLNAKVVKRSV